MFMHEETVLEVERVAKLYSRAQSTTRKRLASTFIHAVLKRQPRAPKNLKSGEFWSLKDVSFTLKRGEALGIIGFNGAGKTTLLRLLAGQLIPDGGEIRVRGKTASMIDLTAGFHMTASGRQNIFLRGAMLGRPTQEIAASYEDIVDFAELGDAIDAPVATYSSGMLMRLAFSIMVAMEPDILFIDEVLAVGDFRFRQKCLSRIRELRRSSAFVLVSHSMEDITRFCDNVLVLSKGYIVFEGVPEAAIKYYHESINAPQVPVKEQKLKKVVGEYYSNKKLITDVFHFWSDAKGDPISDIRVGDVLFFRCRFRLEKKVDRLTLGIPIYSEDGHYVTGFASIQQSSALPSKVGLNEYELKVPNLSINPGIYHSNIVIREGPEYLYRQPNEALHIIPRANRHFGLVSFEHYWRQVYVISLV